MRNLRLLDIYRLRGAHTRGMGWDHNEDVAGAFEVRSKIDRAPLRVIATVGEGWDHVSVSRQTRCPNWPEMEQIAQLFFREDETAMQLHVPASDHVNMHPFCLHWWRPLNMKIPRPPAIMVGVGSTPVKDYAEATQRAREAIEEWPV